MKKYINLPSLGLVLVVVSLLVLMFTLTLSKFQLTDTILQKSIIDSTHYARIKPEVNFMFGKEYSSQFAFLGDFQGAIDELNDRYKKDRQWNDVIWTDYTFAVTKNASYGLLVRQHWLWWFLSFGLGILGGLLYIIPTYRHKTTSNQNNHIFFNPMTSKGWLGIIFGTFLILFYVALYWFPAYLTNWTLLVDPISYKLSGGPASQWFLYGTIYTLVIVVMGIRMLIKYWHSNYHLIRTSSVMFFQVAFAFLIPEILIALNKPWYDFKHIWPLHYDFFFDYKLNSYQSSGAIGMFMLVWGILLIVVAVPVITYFYGKRWYCSWVCGCGGLAETLGDPYRQLSDKSLKAWKIERWMVHSVLVLAVVMTAITLINYFSGYQWLGQATNSLHEWYGFFIGAAFAGVVGTGFYPFMGNRVWCRYGCPLAAYLGIVQRFKSRFRITTNGGQCISCGNCSTYCEMGIDVRWYAQRQQNIVRASCVGCGICASVCPRGVLKLENGPEEGRFYESPIDITGKKATLKV